MQQCSDTHGAFLRRVGRATVVVTATGARSTEAAFFLWQKERNAKKNQGNSVADDWIGKSEESQSQYSQVAAIKEMLVTNRHQNLLRVSSRTPSSLVNMQCGQLYGLFSICQEGGISLMEQYIRTGPHSALGMRPYASYSSRTAPYAM